MTPSKIDRLWRAYTAQSRSTTLIRWLGYGLLILALLDLGDILIPAQLMNPEWEFRSIGAIVERMPVPLIGLIMVFWGEQEYRRSFEKLILKSLSWIALGLALVLLALIPLCIANSTRIYNAEIVDINILKGQRLALVQQLENKLDQTSSVDEFQSLLSRSLNNRLPASLNTSQPLSNLKAQIPALLEPTRSEITRQARATLAEAEQARPRLWKRTIKWSLGALVGAVICLRIWQLTRWTRKKSYL